MEEQFQSVIVRAFDDEPVMLLAHKINHRTRYVYVGKISAKRPIGIPFEDVFEYDDWTFTKLKRAYDSGDKEQLEKEYKEANLLVQFQAAPLKSASANTEYMCSVCTDMVPSKEAWRTGGYFYHEQCIPREIAVTRYNAHD